MPRGKRQRSYAERRNSIYGDLRRTIASTYGIDVNTISDTITLGPDYLDILNEVARLQQRPPLKNHVSMSADSTFNEALAFLLTAVQN